MKFLVRQLPFRRVQRVARHLLNCVAHGGEMAGGLLLRRQFGGRRLHDHPQFEQIMHEFLRGRRFEHPFEQDRIEQVP